MALAAARAQTGAISGKLTDLDAKPLPNATILLRNIDTGATARTISGKSGSYHLGGLAPGEYILEAVTPQNDRGSVDGIVVTPGHEAHVLAALALDHAPSDSATAESADPSSLSPAPPPIEDTASAFLARIAQHSPENAPSTATVSLDAAIAPERLATIALDCKPLWQAAKPVEPTFAFLILSIPSGDLHPELQAMAIQLRVDSIHTEPLIEAAIPIASLTPVPVAFPKTFAQPDPPALETASLSATLTGEQLQSLPLAGRNWLDFVSSEPAQTRSDRAEADPEVYESNASAVDGNRTRLAFAARNQARGALSQPAPSESAISAVRVSRVSDAIDAGERIDLETRRGGNHLHGQTFLFERQNLWFAKNPFTQWVKKSAPATATTTPVFTPQPYTPADRQSTWGGSLGGALRRDRLFWFASLDRDQRNHPAVAIVKHPDRFFAQPTNDEMQVLSARLGLSSANPVAEGISAYSTALESLAGLLGPAPRTSSHWSGFGRLDWNVTTRQRFALETEGAVSDSPGGGFTRSSEAYAKHSFGISRASSEWLLAHWEADLTSNMRAMTQASLSRRLLSHSAEAPSAFEQKLNASAWGHLPQMVVDSRYGFTIGNPARFGSGSYPDEHQFELREGVDWARGPLLIRAGFTLRHDADATSFLPNHTGTYHYAHVENFISDALVFAKYGLTDALDPMSQHNCDQRAKAWRGTDGQLRGLGYLPCYSYYSQTLGPTRWRLSTNDLASFATARWQPSKLLVLSAALRWERQQLPPPMASLDNPDLPLTQKLPALGNEWAPHVSLAWGRRETHWPVLQLGYGMYFSRTSNAVLETALTHTGSLNGDLRFFLRPTDNLTNNGGGAPPFPYVLAGTPGTVEKPAVVEFAPRYRNGEIHQASVTLEEALPGRILVSASALVNLGRRLPVTMDTNFDPAQNPKTITYSVVDATHKGPIHASQLTVPFFASWPGPSGTIGRWNANYQQMMQMMSRANSTYQAGTLRIARDARRGFAFRVRYTYAHATDWNPSESTLMTRSSLLDPSNFRLEYGPGNLDMRHSVSTTFTWNAPWKLKGPEGNLANGWMLSGIGAYHSGLPYTMHTAGSIPEEFTTAGAVIAGLGPGMNGFGGDPRVYGVGRNTWRYPQTWKADLRIGKRFQLSHERELELMAESFNLFNHQNVTELETVGYSIESGTAPGTLPSLHFLNGLKPGQTEFGQPLNINATDSYRPRQFQFGIRIRY